MKRGTENSQIRDTIVFLEQSAVKNKTGIWRTVADRLGKPRRNRVEVGLAKLSRVTKPNQVVVVPGKLLGTGQLAHPLQVTSVWISSSARQKLERAGAKFVQIRELVEKNPKGSQVVLIS